MGNAKEPLANGGTTAGKSAKPDKFTFDDMRLKVGDRLQIQPPSRLSQDRFFVKMIGYLHNVSLLVTAPMASHGLRLQLIEGEKLVARIFSSQNAFGFSCTIDKICKLPFDYLHLSFPSEVQGSQVRKAPRVKTKIIATINTAARGNVSAVITNLSANGAMLDARHTLAEKGESIKLAFRVNLHDIDAYLSVTAIVRAMFSDTTVDNGATFVHHGLEFVNLQTNDSVILQSLIYQNMIEHPDTMI